MGKSVSITDFNSLQRFFSLQKQNRDNAKSKLRVIHALDTETRDGNIFLIADSDSKFLDNITPENIINFLFSFAKLYSIALAVPVINEKITGLYKFPILFL